MTPKDGSAAESAARIAAIRARYASLLDGMRPEPPASVLGASAEDLLTSLEELRIADEQLRQQNEALIESRLQLVAERLRYHDLFHSAPDAYIVTDRNGTILETNRQACTLLQARPRYLAGKGLERFIYPVDRPGFSDLLNDPASRVDMDIRIITVRDEVPVEVSASVLTVPSPDGHSSTLRWIVHPLKQVENHARRASRITQMVQRAILPETIPHAFPGLVVAALYESAWEEALIGGDFYDVFALPNGSVVLAAGDVSCKGLSAVLYASEVKAVLRMALRENPDPAAAMVRVNAYLVDRGSATNRVFVALCLVVVDAETGGSTCVRAGAEPVLVLRNRGNAGSESSVEPFGTPGLTLGIWPRCDYTTEVKVLEGGDRILLMTDGITEARRRGPGNREHPHGQTILFGDEGVATLALSSTAKRSVAQLCRAILDGAYAFAAGPLSDDACILIAERL